jgi:hypothetical protein
MLAAMHRPVPHFRGLSVPAGRLALLSLLLSVALGTRTATAAPTDVAWPTVAELSAKLRQELPSLPAPDASQTNSEVYARSLAPWVLSTAESAPPDPSTALLRTNLYPGASGYLRVGTVGPTLADALRSALAGLAQSGPLAGLVLDLRFASGADFESGIAAASVLASNGPVEFKLGTSTMRTQRDTHPLSVPILILVNGQTRQAAEALASAIRTVAAKSLVVGSPTAGQARTYRRVAVSDSLSLQVAADALRLPDGSEFPAAGLTPDLRISVSEDDERAYAEDEYRRVFQGRPLASVRPGRLNEAELVRRRRHPRSPFEESGPHGDARFTHSDTVHESGADATRAVQDPALAVALDLISGIAADTAAAQTLPGASGESR